MTLPVAIADSEGSARAIDGGRSRENCGAAPAVPFRRKNLREEKKASEMTDSTCDICNNSLPPYSGAGRPRKRCAECASDKSALARCWREQNGERVEAYNASRRVVPSFVCRDGIYGPNPDPRP